MIHLDTFEANVWLHFTGRHAQCASEQLQSSRSVLQNPARPGGIRPSHSAVIVEYMATNGVNKAT